MPDWWYSHSLFGLEFSDSNMTFGWWWVMVCVMWFMLSVFIVLVSMMQDYKSGVRKGSILILLTPIGPVALAVALVVTVVSVSVMMVSAIRKAWT